MRKGYWLGIVALAPALALSACGGSDTSDPDGLSAEELADRADEAVRPLPGLYRSTIEVVKFDIPGAPPQMAEMMRNAMSGSNASHEYCLTPEQVDKGFEDMARNSANGDCRFEKFDVAGGNISAVMACNSPNGGAGRMTLDGTGTPTSSDMTMTMTMEMEMPGMGKGTIVSHAVNSRIGDCPAGAASTR